MIKIHEIRDSWPRCVNTKKYNQDMKKLREWRHEQLRLENERRHASK